MTVLSALNRLWLGNRAAAARPFRALARNGETVIEDAASGVPAAWFPAGFEDITAAATGRVWAGRSRNYLVLIRLEKG